MLASIKALLRRFWLIRALARWLRQQLGVALPPPAGSAADDGRGTDIALWVVDAAVCIPKVGIMLYGWSLDPRQEIAALGVLDAAGQTIADIRSDWARFARADVIAAHPQLAAGTSEPGFVALVHLNGEPPARVSLRSISHSGHSVTRHIDTVAATATPMQLIQVLLSMPALPSTDIRKLYDRHLGPAIEAVWAARDSTPVLGERRQFGSLAEPPRVSVLVPLYGRYDFLRYQLALFADDAEFASAELIYVVDDPSIYGRVIQLANDLAPLFRLPFAVVYGGRNFGYAGANNLGARHAHGDYLVLLNSDVMPTAAGWLGKLIDALDSAPQAGIVAPTLIYDDGAIQHIGMQTEAYPPWDGLPINVHPRKGQPLRNLPSGPQQVEAVTGACMVVRRAHYEALGGLDENYILGDFEDSDFCVRTKAQNLRCYWIPEVVLYHLERQSQNLVSDLNWKARLTLYNCWRHQAMLDRQAQGAAA